MAPVDRDGPLVLSHGQQQMGASSRLDPDSWEYSVPVVLRLRGTLDERVLHRSFEELVGRHEILRTRYRLEGAEPVQIIDPAGPFDLPVDDLTALPGADEREVRATALAEAEPGKPFDLENGWPLRARLIKIAADDHLLAVVFHHVACDEWSVGLFMSELSAVYGAFLEGRPSPLDPMAIQYADYAAWQRKRLAGDGSAGDLLEKQLDYWRNSSVVPPRWRCPPTVPAPPSAAGAATRCRWSFRARWPRNSVPSAPSTAPPPSRRCSPDTRRCSPATPDATTCRSAPWCWGAAAPARAAHRIRHQHPGAPRPLGRRPLVPHAAHRLP